MITACVYLKETGKIVKSISGPIDYIKKQINEGEDYIESKANDGTHYIDNGALVPMPPRPSPDHQFNFNTKEWQDTKTDQQRHDDFTEKARIERNGLLASSDWTQIPDAQLTNEKKQEWQEYRQALRDIPDTLTFGVFAVQWPQKPE